MSVLAAESGSWSCALGLCYGVEELLARIRVALRHASLQPGDAPEPVFEMGDLKVDLAQRQVFRAGSRYISHPQSTSSSSR